MKESLLKIWAHAPWHSWLKSEPAWLDLIAELWSRLPEPALRKLLLTTRTLIILPPVRGGRVVRIHEPMPRGAYIVQLDATLLERPRAEALGILAHEMAHLCTSVTDDELANDLEADRTAIAWGFREELVRALKSDLEDAHPRIAAALAA